MDLRVIVMAGGKGTRFWPESTSWRPKQYLALHGGEPLLRETLKRFESLAEVGKRYVVTLREQETLARECCFGEELIFEPQGRNTAPCILLALASLSASGVPSDSPVIIVPSDHVVFNTSGFRETVVKAAGVACKCGGIVTIGISPAFPHTGYGYIRRGDDLGKGVYKVSSFEEKPDLETAKEYLRGGDCYWNAGMFVARLGDFLEEYKVHAPEVFCYFDGLCESVGDFKKMERIYQKIPADSVDYAVMEKSKRISVVPATFDWSDLGSWEVLEGLIEQREGNTVAAARGTWFKEASGNIVYAPGKFVVIMGVDDVIVVGNERVVMVLPKGKAQSVKEIVSSLDRKEFGDLI